MNAGLTWVPEYDYYDLSNGEIVKLSSNDYEIIGDILFYGIHEDGWDAYQVVITGTYVFSKLE